MTKVSGQAQHCSATLFLASHSNPAARPSCLLLCSYTMAGSSAAALSTHRCAAFVAAIVLLVNHLSHSQRQLWLRSRSVSQGNGALVPFRAAQFGKKHIKLAAAADVETGLPATNKRRLILHVGPSKTATTSLQTDLSSLQGELHADGFAYAGRYYFPYTNATTGDFYLNRSETPLLEAAHSMLKRCELVPRSDCCATFSDQLDTYPGSKKQSRNIILSEEPFGNQWREAKDWKAIRTAIGDHWQVTVVVGYRRFYAWLPSARFQRERIDRNPAQKGPWPDNCGREIRPFFPDWWKHWQGTFSYTANILEALGSTFPVRIINLHNEEQRSPLTTLLCDIMDGEAKKACQRSIQRDKQPTVMNTQTSAPSLYYDAIACTAASQGLIDTSTFNRTVVRDAIRHHQEVDLELRPTDLLLDCPSKLELESLLNTSLAMEAKFMPSFARSPGVRAQHKADFNKYVEEKVYCWVDSNGVLAQPEWKRFLARFK